MCRRRNAPCNTRSPRAWYSTGFPRTVPAMPQSPWRPSSEAKKKKISNDSSRFRKLSAVHFYRLLASYRARSCLRPVFLCPARCVNPSIIWTLDSPEFAANSQDSPSGNCFAIRRVAVPARQRA